MFFSFARILFLASSVLATTEQFDNTTWNPDNTTWNPDNTTWNPDNTTWNPDNTTWNPDNTTWNPDNTTWNPDNTTKPGYEVPSLQTQITLSVLLSVMSLVTISGNFLVIFSVSVFRKLHTIPNMFVTSLATADLIMGAVVIPLGAQNPISGRWLMGEFMCLMWTAIDVLTVTASICTLCMIALDRYVAITMPFKYTSCVTRARARYVIALIWMTSLLIAFMPVMSDLWKSGLDEDVKCLQDETCCEFRANTEYTIVSSFISFYLPSFVMLFSYYIVFKTAIKQRSKIQNNEGVFRRASMPGSRNLLWSKREYKAVFTMGFIMGTFVICWLPFFLCNVIQVLCDRCIPMFLFTIFNWLGYFNSCFNPLIYCHSKEFRRAFKQIFQCSLCKKGYQQTSRASLAASYSPEQSARSSLQQQQQLQLQQSRHTKISLFQPNSALITSRFSPKTTNDDDSSEKLRSSTTFLRHPNLSVTSSYGRYCSPHVTDDVSNRSESNEMTQQDYESVA